MHLSDETVALEDLENGTVLGRINLEIEEAIRNCLDLNYDNSPRKVRVEIKLVPNEQRNQVIPTVAYKTEGGKLIQKCQPWAIGIGTDGRPEAREFVSRQQALFKAGVTPIRSASGADKEES